MHAEKAARDNGSGADCGASPLRDELPLSGTAAEARALVTK
jgi:hypothetical protein